MNDHQLLAYYQQELAYVRRLGAEFAAVHPKIAGRLRLGAKTVEDPHVARLMEAFAFLSARIQYKLKDDFPEISDALLEMLYPHYLAPIPSASIVQFQINGEKLTGLKKIAKNTLLATDTSHGESCHFTTCYPVELWPIEITAASIKGYPLPAPPVITNENIRAVLQLSLSGAQPQLILSDLAFDRLRFFIHAEPQQAYALYELLAKHTVTLALAESAHDKQPVLLTKNSLKVAGFDIEENLLPYELRMSAAHRLLTEFFALPEKFLFFDIVGMGNALKQKFVKPGQRLEIFFYLNKFDGQLEKTVAKQHFALGCTPVVNIFTKYAEPFYLSQAQAEYHLIADAQRPPQATEIYAIKKVTMTDENGDEREYQSFNGLNYNSQDAPAFYYHTLRKPAWQGEHYSDAGTEVFLSFVDQQFNSALNEKSVVNVEVLCTNRDLPGILPFGGGNPKLDFRDNKLDAVSKIHCLVPITPSRRPALKQGARWRLISHLALNHLSLTEGTEGIKALRSILQLYNFNSSLEHENLLQGLIHIKSCRITLRNPNARYGNAFWQGTEISLEVDENKFTGTSIYLFGSILEHFFALYCTINSFTQLIITTRHQGELYRWPPRAGEKALL